MSNPDMTKTQEMPIPETLADIYRNDPLGLYSHRQGMDCRDVDSTTFIDSWNARKPAGDFTDETDGE